MKLFCSHKWEIYKEVELYRDDKAIGFAFILKCEKCGNIKKEVMVWKVSI